MIKEHPGAVHRCPPSGRAHNGPIVRGDEACDDLEQGGLPRSVRSEETEDLTLPYVERDTVERPDGAKPLRHIPQGDGHPSPSPELETGGPGDPDRPFRNCLGDLVDEDPITPTHNLPHDSPAQYVLMKTRSKPSCPGKDDHLGIRGLHPDHLPSRSCGPHPGWCPL